MSPIRKTRCKLCGELKPTENFSNDRSRNTGKFPWCKACVLKYRRERKRISFAGDDSKKCPVCLADIGGTHRNRLYCSDSCKDKARRYRVYGLEPHEYRKLLDATGGKCPICMKNIKKWALDHNHGTGETMGLTCINCNVKLLAFCYHNPQIAQNLLDFLESPPVRRMFGGRRYVGPEQLSQLHRMWAWGATKLVVEDSLTSTSTSGKHDSDVPGNSTEADLPEQG